MSSIIKVGDSYLLDNCEMLVTHLFERSTIKKEKCNFINVDKVDLNQVPPPRQKQLHQNRYGICKHGKTEMFLKFLSPGFYSRSKKVHGVLKPYAQDLFVESFFNDDLHVIAQPRLKASMQKTKLSPSHVEKNVNKISSFTKKVDQCEDSQILNCFNHMDIDRANFMVDYKEENLYIVDFDPWPHKNDIEVWSRIIEEISNGV